MGLLLMPSGLEVWNPADSIPSGPLTAQKLASLSEALTLLGKPHFFPFLSPFPKWKTLTPLLWLKGSENHFSTGVLGHHCVRASFEKLFPFL